MGTGIRKLVVVLSGVMALTPASTSVKAAYVPQYLLAVKYVAYENSDHHPTVTQSEAMQNVMRINRIYSTCKIRFQIDPYLVEKPNQYDLHYHTENDSELDRIRKTFEDSSTLLVVTTGKWNRSGSLGKSKANAWTNLPGMNSYGAILEYSVGTFANIIAHELGHYLNLLHTQDRNNIMNPVIYNDSTQLTPSQCSLARTAIETHWKKMLR